MKFGKKLERLLLAEMGVCLIVLLLSMSGRCSSMAILLSTLFQIFMIIYIIVVLVHPLQAYARILEHLNKTEFEREELRMAPAGVPFVKETYSLLDRYAAYKTRKNNAQILNKQTELTALQSQINPHFLYNTLETIRGQALIDDNEEIAKMVEALSAFFRYSISRKGNLVTLRDELANIENYMLIQRYRFNNRFSMEVLIDEEDEEAFDFLIQRLIIQPVVENAIFHGLISDNGKGMDADTLKELNARIQSNNVELDDREERNQRNTGIALPNIHKRIQLLFGEEYGVNVYSTAGQGTDVEITIPANYKTDREKDHEERIAEN